MVKNVFKLFTLFLLNLSYSLTDIWTWGERIMDNKMPESETTRSNKNMNMRDLDEDDLTTQNQNQKHAGDVDAASEANKSKTDVDRDALSYRVLADDEAYIS